jgi:hypothetical protein
MFLIQKDWGWVQEFVCLTKLPNDVNAVVWGAPSENHNLKTIAMSFFPG